MTPTGGLIAGPLGQWLRFGAIAGLGIVLAAGTLLPVYTDEIGWRFQERAWVDGVDKMFSDLCGPNTLAVPPWFMMPVRWFSAVANQALADPLFIRLEGVVCALALMALLWRLIGRLEGARGQRSHLQALVFALLGLGVLPLLLVMSRPEQPLLLALASMMLIALAPPRNNVFTWPRVAAIVLLATIAASYHLKGVVYAPIALTCIFICAKGRSAILPRVLGGGILIVMTLSAMRYWVSRFQCPGDPILAKMYGENSLAAAIGAGMPLKDAALQAAKGVSLWEYVKLAAPSNDPMSAWIPKDLFPALVPPLVTAGMLLIWGAAIAVAIALLARFIWRERLKVLSEPRALLALAILACVMVWGASQVGRNVYEASHVLPLLAVFVAMCIALPDTGTRWRPNPLRWLTPLVVGAALVSQVVVLAFTAKPLLAATHSAGALPDQEFSVSIAHYGTVRADVAKAMALAGIDGTTRQYHLMIDDVTYLALQRHLLPIHRLGVTAVWNGSIENPAEYLMGQKSAGIVVACRNLPMEMDSAAVRSGEICAISPGALKELAAPLPSIWDEG